MIGMFAAAAAWALRLRSAACGLKGIGVAGLRPARRCRLTALGRRMPALAVAGWMDILLR